MPGVYFHITNVNDSGLAFADSAAKKLLSIVNQPSFQQKISSANFSGRKFRLDGEHLKFIQADNATVLSQVMNGKEWGKAPDGNINLLLTVGPTNPGVIGYVLPPNPLITTRTSFFNRCMAHNSRTSLAAHWMHEWMHVSGFRHSGSTVDRNDVPYMTGSFVVAVARELAALDEQPATVINAIGQDYLDSYAEQFRCVEEGL